MCLPSPIRERELRSLKRRSTGRPLHRSLSEIPDPEGLVMGRRLLQQPCEGAQVEPGSSGAPLQELALASLGKGDADLVPAYALGLQSETCDECEIGGRDPEVGRSLRRGAHVGRGVAPEDRTGSTVGSRTAGASGNDRKRHAEDLPVYVSHERPQYLAQHNTRPAYSSRERRPSLLGYGILTGTEHNDRPAPRIKLGRRVCNRPAQP